MAFRRASLDEAADLVPFGGQRELIDHVRREFVEREPSASLRMALEQASFSLPCAPA